MKDTKKKVSSGLLLLCAMMVFPGCSDQENEKIADDSVTINSGQSRNPGWPVYTVGVDANYAPFALRDEHGQVIGYDKDLLDAIGEIKHFYVDFIPTEWNDAIFERLDTGNRDIIASGATINEERKQKWGVTVPVKSSGYAFMADRKSNINSVDDLYNKSVVVQGGGGQEKALLENYASGIGEIKTTPTTYLAYEAVLRGEADAVFSDSAILSYYAANMPKGYYQGTLELIVPADETSADYGFYVKKSNTALLDSLNDGIDQLQKNGRFDAIEKKWFGFEGQ